MRGQTYNCLQYSTFRTATGGLLTPRTPVAHLAATSSARCLAFLTLERAHTRPYTILRQAVKSPSNAGRLRSSTVGFAEPFRSVCRNVSGKLSSHPFAALTGLRGCAADAVGSHHLLSGLFPLLNDRQTIQMSDFLRLHSLHSI